MTPGELAQKVADHAEVLAKAAGLEDTQVIVFARTGMGGAAASYDPDPEFSPTDMVLALLVWTHQYAKHNGVPLRVEGADRG